MISFYRSRQQPTMDLHHQAFTCSNPIISKEEENEMTETRRDGDDEATAKGAATCVKTEQEQQQAQAILDTLQMYQVAFAQRPTKLGNDGLLLRG